MATECRRTKRVNKQRLVRLLTVIAVSIATAFTIGRLTAPTKTDTVTVTKTVEVLFIAQINSRRHRIFSILMYLSHIACRDISMKSVPMRMYP